MPDYAVFVNPPPKSNSATSRRPAINRPPPRHPGVQIPGVEHPQDSGSIQDIIEHIDESQDKVSSFDYSPDRHTSNQFNENIQKNDFEQNKFTPNSQKADFDHHLTPEFPKHEFEEHQEFHHQEHEYQGYRPPIGYKGPPKDYHSPPPIYTHDSSLLPEKYSPPSSKPHFTDDYHEDPKPTYYEKPVHQSYPSQGQYNPLTNTYKPSPPVIHESYQKPVIPYQEQNYYEPKPISKPYIPPYQPDHYSKPVEKPIPPVEAYNKGPVGFQSLINPPGPDIFDGQSLYAPPGGLQNYHGVSKNDGQTPANDRIQENGFSNNQQQQQQQYSNDPDFYSSVNKVQPIILLENSNSGNGQYNYNSNDNYQTPQQFSPYDQHAKGSKHYSIHQQESPAMTSRPTSSINLNTINSYTSMGASNSHANLQGSSSSNGMSPYTYSSGMTTFYFFYLYLLN